MIQLPLDTDLEYYIGHEVYVYISGEDNDSDALIGDLFVFDNVADLQEHLIEVDPVDDIHYVLHGVLTKADVLPNDIDKGCVFVIGRNPYDKPVCVLGAFEGNNVDRLAGIIEELIENCGVPTVTLDDIDDVFVLYGYELSRKITVDEDEIDDERLEVCNDYLKVTDSIRKANDME